MSVMSICLFVNKLDADQPNTKLNRAKVSLEVSSGPFTRERAKKHKDALNRHV